MNEAIQVLQTAKRAAEARLGIAEGEGGKHAANKVFVIRHAIRELDEGIAVLVQALQVKCDWINLGTKLGSTSDVQAIHSSSKNRRG